MAKKSPYPHQEILTQYEKIVASVPQIERKGATMPYTSFQGNMFSFLNKEGQMGLRLAKEELETFLQKHKTERIESHNTVMKEYARVPADLFNKTTQMKKYFAQSFAYVQSLKPKPTTRKKK